MGYTWEGMEVLPWDMVKQIHETEGLAGYFYLYGDNTEVLIEDYEWEDIERHHENGGLFGKEIKR